MRTLRQQRGADAEDIAVAFLLEAGWRVVSRNLKVGRDEIDIVAIDPGPPVELVCVEVRSARSAHFGAPEERLDRVKVRNLYRAMWSAAVDPTLPRRVDVVVIDGRASPTRVRHLRRIEPA